MLQRAVIKHDKYFKKKIEIAKTEIKSILISEHTVLLDSAETRTDKKTPLITPIYLLKLRLFGPN